MIQLLAVGAGGALGAMARYGLAVAAGRAAGSAFPYGTLCANLLGCFAMGLLVAVFTLREPVDPILKLFLATGVLGGFTTFSAFSLETLVLFDRKPALGLSYAAASVVLSVGACWLGLRFVRWIHP